MTPTMPEVSVSGDTFTEIGQLLADEPETQETSVEASEPVVDTPAGEEPTTPELESTPEVTPAGEAPTSPYTLTEDGKSYIVPKDKFSVFDGHSKYASEVSNIFPTANDAQIAHGESSDLRAMKADYINGDERSMDAFLKHWAGEDYKNDPGAQKQYQENFVKMAEKVPQILKDINPDAYSKFTGTIVTQQIESAYERAAEAYNYATNSNYPPDKEYADLLLKQAQQLEWGSTGQVRGKYNPESGEYQYEFPKYDPRKAEQEKIAKEAESIKAREAQMLDRDFKSFDMNIMSGPKWNNYKAEIAKILDPVKSKYDPALFEALVDKIDANVIKALNQDYDWARNHNNAYASLKKEYEQLWRNNRNSDELRPKVQAFQNDFMARVRRLIPSTAAPYLNKATASAIAPPAPRQARPATQRPTQASPAKTQGKTSLIEDNEYLNLWK